VESILELSSPRKALPVFFVSKDKEKLLLLMSQTSWSRKKEYDFTLYKTHVNLKKDGYLIFSNNFYPGWKVYVNNKMDKIEKCFGIYMGVKIKKGIHNIIFKYSPLHLRLFLLLNFIIVALLLSLGILCIYLLYSKK